MSIYTTPLQFGYFAAWLYAVLLWVRGARQERRSDTLLGWVMWLLGQQIQDYTLGFAGINVLWEELDGFPRSTTLLFGPAMYFYLSAQLNRGFRLQRKHLLHLLPWLLVSLPQLAVFLQGPYAVQRADQHPLWQAFGYAERLGVWASMIAYFVQSLRLYRSYRAWMLTQFSDPEAVSFAWYRNFIYGIAAGFTFKELMRLADWMLDWSFYDDWWWNLGMVGLIVYVGVQGYAQYQPRQIAFVPAAEPEAAPAREAVQPPPELEAWKAQLGAHMGRHRPYLDPELTLADLARQLQWPAAQLSAVINSGFGQNFNDFINRYRVQAFQELVRMPENQQFTLLALALEAGFNSKATFNRAFRKHTGSSPREWMQAPPAADAPS